MAWSTYSHYQFDWAYLEGKSLEISVLTLASLELFAESNEDIHQTEDGLHLAGTVNGQVWRIAS